MRREPLPLLRDGVYEERFGDLEKLGKADIVEQMERVELIKAQIAAFQRRQDEAAAKATTQSTPTGSSGAPVSTPAGGEPSGQTPPLQGS